LEEVLATKEDEETEEVVSTQAEEEDTEVEASVAEEAAGSHRTRSRTDAAWVEEAIEECITATRRSSKTEEKEVATISPLSQPACAIVASSATSTTLSSPPSISPR
jgi:hypothetical protein